MNIAIIKSREIRLVNFFSNIANRWLFSKKLNHFLQKILYCTFDIFAPQRAFWPEYTRPGTKGMASKSNSTKIRLRCHYKRTKTHKKYHKKWPYQTNLLPSLQIGYHLNTQGHNFFIPSLQITLTIFTMMTLLATLSMFTILTMFN